MRNTIALTVCAFPNTRTQLGKVGKGGVCCFVFIKINDTNSAQMLSLRS